MSEEGWKTYSSKKVIPPSALEEQVACLRRKNKTIATLNGSFDLLHAGHLYILYEAAQTADILIVALNSDTSIRSYKSLHRPIIPLSYRIEMVTAIEFVDYVTWFEEVDPRELLLKIKPDVHVNGAEYGSECIEAETVKKLGARLHLVPRIEGLSTSAILKKIHELPCD